MTVCFVFFNSYCVAGIYRIAQMGLQNYFGMDGIVVSIYEWDTFWYTVYISRIATICASIAMVLLTIFVSLLIGCCITNPLRKLTVIMKQISAMNFKHHTKLSSLHEFTSMEDSLRHMETGLQSFSKFVPFEVVRGIVSSKQNVSSGVQSQWLSVMFCDIVHFTSIAETIEPLVLIHVLEEFFTQTTSVIQAQQGTVDKFIGDCVM